MVFSILNCNAVASAALPISPPSASISLTTIPFAGPPTPVSYTHLDVYKRQVLSREKLEQHIWNYDYSGESNVIDVYIRYLRKKIDEGHAHKLLHTIRGVGYVLKVDV